MMAQLRNRNQRQPGLARSMVLEQAHKLVLVQVRNRNRQRHHMNDLCNVPLACSTSQHASRKDRHRPEQLHNHNQRQQELARSMELVPVREQARNKERVLEQARSKALVQAHNRNRQRHRMSDLCNAPSACSTSQHASRKDRHKQEQLRIRNQLLELARRMELVLVLARSMARELVRNRNRKTLRKSDSGNEHEACSASQHVTHMDQHN
jgi:hypothetical protein